MQVISCSALLLNEAGDRALISRRSEHRRTAPKANPHEIAELGWVGPAQPLKPD